MCMLASILVIVDLALEFGVGTYWVRTSIEVSILVIVDLALESLWGRKN